MFAYAVLWNIDTTFALAIDVKDEEPPSKIVNAIAAAGSDCFQTPNFRPRFFRGGGRRATAVQDMQRHILPIHDKNSSFRTQRTQEDLRHLGKSLSITMNEHRRRLETPRRAHTATCVGLHRPADAESSTHVLRCHGW